MQRSEKVNLDKKLFNAIYKKRPDRVSFWISAGANLNAINSSGETPLQYAFNNHIWNCFKIIVEHTEKKINVSLRYAIANAPDYIVKLLIKKGCNIENIFEPTAGHFALHTAITKQNYAIVQLLLESKANPSLVTAITSQNKQELTPLMVAIGTDQHQMVRLLLDFGADPDMKAEYDTLPIIYAKNKRAWDCVSEFLRHPKCKISEATAENLLNAVVEDNQVDILKKLIEKQVSLNRVPSSKGYFPIHYAVKNNNIPLTVFLLESKADPFKRTVITNENKKENSPLDIALEYGNRELIHIFMEKSGIKNQKLDELCFDVASQRATFDGVTKCIDYYKFTPDEIFHYLQLKKNHQAYFLCLLAVFLFCVDKEYFINTHEFKDVQLDGHRYVAKSLMVVIGSRAESDQNFYRNIKDFGRNILKSLEIDSKNSSSTFPLDEFANLIFLKNKYVKMIRDKISNITQIHTYKIFLLRIAAIEDIQDRILLHTYSPDKIQNQLKLIYGKDIFYSGFFDRNPLMNYVTKLNVSENIQVESQQYKPPQFNPDFQPRPSEEPGFSKNPYLDMNFFPQKMVAIDHHDNQEKDQIEGEPGREGVPGI